VRPVEVTTFTTPRERGVTAGVFYLAGSVVAYLSLVAPGVARGPMLLVAIGSTLVGLAAIARRERFTPTVTNVVVGMASMLIGLAVVIANGGVGSAMLMAGYLMVAVFVALLGSRTAAQAQTAWATVTLLVAATLVWPLPLALALSGAFMAVAGTITVVAAMLASRLRRSAMTDPLTGVANRSGFGAALDAAVATVERTGEPLSVLLLDLDDFKLVNDRAGHAAGDDLLREATHNWAEQVRARDTLARLGGDEFAVVMPGADGEAAADVAKRLEAATPQVGCSIGIAVWAPGQSVDELLAAADERLYVAKQRDVAVFGHSAPPPPTGKSALADHP